MDEEDEMVALRLQEARRVRAEACKCLRHASSQLGKASYEIDEYIKNSTQLEFPFGVKPF